MEDRRKEILERLSETCQVPLEDKNEQLKIIDKQEKEILKNKRIALKRVLFYI
ncbi:hypothetical protein [Tenacibaculum maritimum]|uniref:hypothetical protein n=1 Tax=Tenacibaculum maritimum TaxID=107401 RepID=UPI0038778DA4